MTQVQWLEMMGGGPYLLNALAQTLASGVAAKLPVWPGLEPLAEALADAGVPLIDPHLPAAAIARNTPLVVTNGPSSVLAEAAQAGHRPVCVLPVDADRDFAGQLGALDVALCRDSEFGEVRRTAGVVRPAGPRFDLTVFVDAVEDALRWGRDD